MTTRVKVLGLCVAALGAIHCGSNGNGNGGGDGGPNPDGSHTGRDGTSGSDGSNGSCNQTLAGSWQPAPSGTAPLPTLTSVYPASANDVWATGTATVAHLTGGSWGLTTTTAYVPATVTGSSSNDVWVSGISVPPNGSGQMGHEVLQHWSGGMFDPETDPSWGTGGSPITTSFLFEVGAHDIWAVGVAAGMTAPAAAGHYDGSAWTLTTTGLAPGASLIAVWSPGPGDAIAVGDNTWRWSGTTMSWTQQAVTRFQMEWYKSVWGFSANDIWIAGNYGYIQHWDGTAWHTMDAGANTDINGIWGSSPNDVWFMGDNFAAHWDGSCFQQITLPTANGLSAYVIQAVFGRATNDIWAVGGDGLHGVVLHFH